MSSKNILSRAKKAGAWNAIGTISWRLLSSITSILLARILGPSGLGEYGMIRSTAGAIGAFAGLRLGFTSSRYVAKYRDIDSTKTGAVIALILLMSLFIFSVIAFIVIIFSHELSASLLGRNDASTLLIIGVILTLTTMFGVILVNTIQGFENFKGPAKVNVLKGLLTPIIILPGALYFGVIGALGGFLVVAIIILWPLFKLLRIEKTKYRIPSRLSKEVIFKEYPVLLHFGVPGLLISLMFSFVDWFGKYLLITQDGGSQQLGIFIATDQWRIVITLIPFIISTALFPIMANSHGKTGSDYANSVNLSIQVCTLAATAPALMCMMLSDYLFLLYGEEYKGIGKLILILIPGIYLGIINQTITQIYSSMGRRWLSAMIYIIYSTAFAMLAYSLIPKGGSHSLSWAIVISQFVLLVMQIGILELFVEPKLIRPTIPIIVVMLTMVVIMADVRATEIVPNNLVFSIATFIIIWIVFKLKKSLFPN